MALAPLSPFVAALVALGLATLLTLLVLALVNFLSNAPVIGGWIADKATSAEHYISNALGQAFSGIDAFIGGAFHQLALFLDHLWGIIATTPQTMLKVAEALVPISAAIHAVRALAHAATHALRGLEHGIRTVQREFHGIEHRVKTIEHDLAKGIGHDLRLEVRTLKKELHRVENRTIPGVKDIADGALTEADNLYEWAKGKASLLGVGTFSFAIATALGALGLDWIKCKEGKQIYNQKGCGMWSDLGGLLGVFAAVIAVSDFEELVKEMQAAEQAAVAGIEELLNL